ncbi:hypothetical protein X777_05507 [Ooceraea biroi]|uniref:Uncharacterized protein n=1 Tax=Ooceraea biroi TaxID=2015173 RepID=A0A026WEZ2_OOCBI|nr:hypothetical protein X777_05507 [Ooceraea biroi]
MTTQEVSVLHDVCVVKRVAGHTKCQMSRLLRLICKQRAERRKRSSILQPHEENPPRSISFFFSWFL